MRDAGGRVARSAVDFDTTVTERAIACPADAGLPEQLSKRKTGWGISRDCSATPTTIGGRFHASCVSTGRSMQPDPSAGMFRQPPHAAAAENQLSSAVSAACLI